MRIFYPFLLLCLFASPLASAMQGIFWQPQLRDSSVTASQWAALMRAVQRQGFDTLVIQWTRYGEALNDETSRQQLIQRAIAAKRTGLKVIVGLYADPTFFQRQQQSGAALTHYLQRLLVADLRQSRAFTTDDFQPDGWYISAEIDDLNWRQPAAQRALLAWLADARQRLTAGGKIPLYISSFFAGNMTPAGYGQLLAGIRQRGVGVWIQDGQGVGTLTPDERQRYLEAATGCTRSTPGSGTVYEIFQQLSTASFSARPLAASVLSARLAQASGCGKDRLYFSLRYLPAAQGILAWTPVSVG